MNDPALYARTNDLALQMTTYFCDEFSDEFSQMSGRCIDIGSGPGNTAVDLIVHRLNKEASLVCSDISEKMVNFAREKYEDNKRVSFTKLDIETPDLPKDLVGQFDHVLSFWCLHWCPDMRQVFENIFSSLRPGGSTFLLFIANTPELNSYQKLEATPRYQPYIKARCQYFNCKCAIR